MAYELWEQLKKLQQGYGFVDWQIFWTDLIE